ncbi:hypothetical protein WJX84_003624 [Apatococcus fuscideae]|uniref:Uncharacterized protein n=1 Tax=Apatococcus fuscideae TaxID=2026836 RepID=A0AAW1SWS2_9CHLO
MATTSQPWMAGGKSPGSFVPCASKRKSHLRRQMLSIGASGGLEHFSPEVDEEDLANLQWQTGRVRFIGSS